MKIYRAITTTAIVIVVAASAAMNAAAGISMLAKPFASSSATRLAAAMIFRPGPSGVTWASIFPATPPSWSRT